MGESASRDVPMSAAEYVDTVVRPTADRWEAEGDQVYPQQLRDAFGVEQ